MQLDRHGFRVLDPAECSSLLRGTRLGRIALTQAALPVILPVGFAMLDDDLMFNVGGGALAQAAHQSQVVCFESDWADADMRDMWSVWVVGQLSPVVDADQLQRAGRLDLPIWSSRPSEFVRLAPQIFSGRRRNLP